MNLFLTGPVDRKGLQALIQCRTLEHADLIMIFEKLFNDTKAALVRADDVVRIHRLQGRAEVLGDFLEAVKESPSVLERLK